MRSFRVRKPFYPQRMAIFFHFHLVRRLIISFIYFYSESTRVYVNFPSIFSCPQGIVNEFLDGLVRGDKKMVAIKNPLVKLSSWVFDFLFYPFVHFALISFHFLLNSLPVYSVKMTMKDVIKHRVPFILIDVGSIDKIFVKNNNFVLLSLCFFVFNWFI